MPIINLLNQSNPTKSTDENAVSLINMYMVADQDQGKYSTAAYYTPGLTLFSSLGASVRALFTEHNILYAVAGNKFYSVNSSGTATSLGTLLTSTGFCKIRGNNNQLFIFDGTYGYYYTVSTNSFAQITNDTYVSSVTMTAAGNNYTIANPVFLGSVGSGASATATLTAGQVSSVSIVNSGSGYTGVAPSIYFNVTSGTGATATATLSGGVITSIAVNTPGNNYAAPVCFIVDSTGSGATATCTITNGGLTSVTVTAGGTGYTSPKLYFYDLGGAGATGTVSTSGSAGALTVTGVTITSSGIGYITPTITFVDATGTGASGTVQVSQGKITGVTITSAGSGYTNPVCTITDLSGGGASGTVNLTTSSFPTSVIDIECQDEFGIALQANSQQWNTSNVSDLKTWPALSTASTTGSESNLVAIISLDRFLWLFQESTAEVWYNAGNAYFTFSRYQPAYVEWGCAATRSVAYGNNTAVLLGKSITGGIQVIILNGFGAPTVISNQGVNYQLSTYTTVSDAIGYCYQQEGHEFYVLTFPTMNVTWVYDFTTQNWHQRMSSGNSWIPTSFAYCYNKALGGDLTSGNIYQLDMTNYTENGTAITRTLVTHPFYNTGTNNLGQQVYCDRLQIDFDTSPGAGLSAVNLFISRDGGYTFGSAKPAQPVQTSDGQWRCYWPRLGRARTWVFKIQTSIASKFIILGAWANIREGGN